MLGTDEAVLGLVRIHREEAAVLERRHDAAQAKLLRDIATEYERVVQRTRPDWLSIAAVQARTGWSTRNLWDRAQCFAEETPPRARKKRGRWQFERSAVEEIPVKNAQRTSEVRMKGRTRRDLAAQLGSET